MVGAIVKYCIERKSLFKDLKLSEFKKFHPEFEDDIFDKIKPKSVVQSRVSLGGTGFDQVKMELKNWEKRLLL